MKARNKNILLLFVTSIIILYTSLAYGENNEPEYVRIGLKGTLNMNNNIVLSSDGFEVGVFDKEYSHLFEIKSKTILARADSFYNIENINYEKIIDSSKAQIGPFHIEVDMTFNDYEELSEKIDLLSQSNITAYPVYSGSEFRIWIGQYINEEAAKSNATTLANILGESMNIIKENKDRVVFEDGNGQILLMFNSNDKIVLCGKNNGQTPLIKVGKYFYRDYITFSRSQDDFIAINYVMLNNYLYGVVPREMSASWPIEALKAQAVAARNYTLLNINKHSNSKYDLCDTQDCQVYGGHDWENIKSNTAVDETADNVLKYDGKLVSTFYHSSSGGHTENSENVWSASIPYIRGVDDEFSLGSPNDEWQLVMSKEEILKKLLDNGIDIGEVLSIDTLKVSEYGRVIELMISGSIKDEILKKEKSRLVFGAGSLKSTWFNVKSDADVYILNGDGRSPIKTSMTNNIIISSDGKVSINKNSNTKFLVTDGVNQQTVYSIPSQYIFDGKGWGHGLGMSQWGAKKMAEMGYNFKEILEYYYSGAIVE